MAPINQEHRAKEKSEFSKVIKTINFQEAVGQFIGYIRECILNTERTRKIIRFQVRGTTA